MNKNCTTMVVVGAAALGVLGVVAGTASADAVVPTGRSTATQTVDVTNLSGWQIKGQPYVGISVAPDGPLTGINGVSTNIPAGTPVRMELVAKTPGGQLVGEQSLQSQVAPNGVLQGLYRGWESDMHMQPFQSYTMTITTNAGSASQVLTFPVQTSLYS